MTRCLRMLPKITVVLSSDDMLTVGVDVQDCGGWEQSEIIVTTSLRDFTRIHPYMLSHPDLSLHTSLNNLYFTLGNQQNKIKAHQGYFQCQCQSHRTFSALNDF